MPDGGPQGFTAMGEFKERMLSAIDSLAGRIDDQNKTLNRVNTTLTRLETKMEDVEDLKVRMTKVERNQFAAGISPSSTARTATTATAGGGAALILLELVRWISQYFQ